MGNLLKRQCGGSTQTLLALQLHTLVGDVLCFLLGLHNMERVACLRSTVQSEDDDWLRGSSLLHTLVALVEHSLDASPCSTGNHDVALLERTVADKHC